MSPSGSPLPDAQTGQRWVIRHRLPDGSATDLIGWLQLVVADFVHLATADGAVHIVERASVVAARRAPAAPGGPPPDRVSSAEVEHRALSGWLALHEPLGEWTLRAAGGFTGRANSCQAVGDPGMAIAAAADRIVEYSAEHAIAPLAQVVAGSAEEQALRDLGWTDTYVPTEVLAIRLADFLGEVMPDPGVRVSNTLSPQWWQAYQLSRPNDADPAMLKMILDGQPPRAFAGVETGAETVAIGRGHLSRDWLGLASVWTAPEHRRQGWATKIMIGLGHWAARRGARYAYLQVATANAAAITAYERLGFARHHRYLYLEPGPG